MQVYLFSSFFICDSFCCKFWLQSEVASTVPIATTTTLSALIQVEGLETAALCTL